MIAVENALTSLSDDIATTRRVIDAQKAPVVLVGHSYGGVSQPTLSRDSSSRPAMGESK